MAKDLHRQAKAIGLRININKSKLVTNQNTDRRPPFIVAGQQVKQVSEFVYLGQTIGDSTKRQKEIGRRVTAGWRSFFKYKMIYTSKRTPIFLKRRLFNSCVLPTMLYGAETWSLTKREENWLAVAQRRMERIMTGTSLRQWKTNDWLRKLTQVNDVMRSYWQRKWRWAQRIAKMDEDRWARRVTEWQPRIGKRGRGRPKKRWRDEIVKVAGIRWMAIAKKESCWRQLKEKFLNPKAAVI
uniref:Endonuclease-reverse transcriptase n=1 Tax=Plectus sambesii TaxID=2011161 RepID=A0A914UM23_9BILA